ncbi:MAG: hypothetical protein R2883_08165 [Caldisericia bacterium]
MSGNLLEVAAPKITLKSARTGKPLSSELFDPASFDLAYGIDNPLLIELHPADDRDLPMRKMDHQSLLVVQTVMSFLQGGFVMMDDNIHPITYMTLTPTGHGEEVIYLGYKCPNTWMDD